MSVRQAGREGYHTAGDLARTRRGGAMERGAGVGLPGSQGFTLLGAPSMLRTPDLARVQL